MINVNTQLGELEMPGLELRFLEKNDFIKKEQNIDKRIEKASNRAGE